MGSAWVNMKLGKCEVVNNLPIIGMRQWEVEIRRCVDKCGGEKFDV